MLFLCNPGTSARTTRRDPAWSFSRLAGQDTLQTTRRFLHTTRLLSSSGHELRVSSSGPCPAALQPGHTPRCHSSNSSLYEPSVWKGGRDGALNDVPASLKATVSFLLDETLVFFGFHQFSSYATALLHLGHSGTHIIKSLIISIPSSVGLRQ